MILTLGRTSEVTHPPWYKRGVDGTPSWVFVMLQYFEKISPLVESLWCALQDEVEVMGCHAAGAP